jgi:hypothetical protein
MTQNALNTSIPIEVDSGGTEAATLTDHGVLLGSGTGAITATAAGTTGTVLIGNTGVDASFSATPTVTSISFGGDALAYYDEGTWTPVLSFGGGSTGITYVTQTGTYTRIGDTVSCYMKIALTNKGSSTGITIISGLPFTSGVLGFIGVIGRMEFIDITATEKKVTLENTGSSTTMTLIANASVGHAGRQLTNAAFANNSAITVNFEYFNS